MIIMEHEKDLNKILNHLHKGMLQGKYSVEDVSETMVFHHDECMEYKEKAMEGHTFSEIEKQNVFLIIEISQYLYNYTGLTTGFTDLEYDSLYEIYIGFGNEDIISVDLPFDTKDTAEHKYPSLRGTLTKVYYLSDDEIRKNPTRKYLSEWIASRERKIFDKTEKHVNLSEEPIYVFPKWDGVSCIFEFNPDGSLNTALTRGNVETNIAQNITKCFPNMKGRETKNGYGLKTEIMMREEDLKYFNDKYKTDYKNTRSVVASILNSDTLDERNDLLVIQRLRDSELVNGEEILQVLDPGAFQSPFIRCKLKDIDQIKEFAEAHRYVDGLRCDGAVIYIINPELQEILGRENNKNNYEVAYKFTEEASMTKLKDVIFQVGLFGNLAPVAIVEPVKLKGNTISRISLGSMARFNSLNLRKGDKVKVLYDIIPYMVFDSDCEHGDGKKIKSPDTCPECGGPLTINEGDDFYSVCKNKDCPCRIKGTILNYVQKMNISNISYETIGTLYDKLILRRIEDLYMLKSKIPLMLEIDGFGEAKINSFIESIESHTIVPDYVLLGSIGVSGISIETCKKILSKYTMDELLDIVHRNQVSKLCEIPGIKDKKAQKIIDGIHEKRKTIDTLQKLLTITHPSIEETMGRFSVVFTKVRDPELEEWITKNGGEVSDTLKKTTTYLIVPNEDVTSSKVSNAKKYGVKIVPIDKVMVTIQKDYPMDK